MALKLVAKGVVGHPGAYFRTPWDVFDGVIVVTSLVALSGVQAQATVLRSLRLLRLLRPLRLLRKWRGMQLVVETLIQSIPSVSNVLLFGIFLMGIFAILGVQLFAGRMSRCNQAVVEGVTVAWRDECTPGVFICQEADLCSTGEELATLDAFMALAQQCIDTVGVDNQPKEKNAPWMGLYVLSFVFLGSWFWVNLLVSVVVQFYSKLVVEKGDVLVSKQAKEYVKLFRLTNKADYWKGVPVPSNMWRARALRIVAHPYFDRVTIAVVVTNVIIMGCDHYNETDEFSLAMTGLNFGFTSCFVVEMVL
ncbi:voltage-gated Ca2+ channel, alpha subunit, partial [Haematococcus lacustris]